MNSLNRRQWLRYTSATSGTAAWAAAVAGTRMTRATDDQPIDERKRCDELGISIGVLDPGPQNSILDLADLSVGHQTMIRDDHVRTGVTIIKPHAENIYQQKVPAAIVVGNGFGKLVGSTQVHELGTIETPIGLTNTLSTFRVADSIIRYSLSQPDNENVRSVNPVVGECNDGYLNDIRGQHVTDDDVSAAIDACTRDSIGEGCVGAGTGTRCLGWKGGIGSSSRRLPDSLGGFLVGCLVQTNFGGNLTVGGAPVGRELGRYYLRESVQDEAVHEKGSCIVVIATDAPLDSRQLRRLASRALLGLAATGSPITHGSGDYVIAFSTHPSCRVPNRHSSRIVERPSIRDENLSPLFQAARDSTEEAVLNSLFMATSMTGMEGRTTDAIPLDDVLDVCREHQVIPN